jgi:hypothetical protein
MQSVRLREPGDLGLDLLSEKRLSKLLGLLGWRLSDVGLPVLAALARACVTWLRLMA